MNDVLRWVALGLFAVGPLVAVPGLVRRGLEPLATLNRVRGWRWYVPTLLLPIEWLLPPVLIAFRVGEVELEWLSVRVVGIAVAVAGAGLLVWACMVLGRFLVHDAAIRPDHVLIEGGPYRFVRHPVYAGYLALLLGCGVAAANVGVLLLWPVSLAGILIQAASEERVLRPRFGESYARYASRTGGLVPRFW